MTLNRDLSGTGAMLVRLLGIGARGGLTPETTLLHVLDGVPLPQAALVIPRLTPEAMEAFRNAGPGAVVPGPVHVADGAMHPGPTAAHSHETDTSVDEGDEPLCFAFPEADNPARQDQLDALNAEAIERELEPDRPTWLTPELKEMRVALSARLAAHRAENQGTGWTPAKGSKADQALDLWSTTRLGYAAIAERTGSTREAVRSVVRMARERGEPRATRPELTDDPIRAQVIAEALALPLKRDRALLLWQRTSLRPGEIAELIGSTGPSVSNYVTVARHQQSEQVRDGDRLRGLSDDGHPTKAAAGQALLTSSTDVAEDRFEIPIEGWSGLGREVSPERADEECAEPVVEPANGLPDGAFPAPPNAQDVPEEKGTVRQEQPAPVSPEVPDTADRPAGPGLEHPSPRGLSPLVARLAKKTGADPRLEELLDLYGTTTRLQKDIGAELGLSEFKVSTLIKAARAGSDPRVVTGDAARAALKAAAIQEQAEPTSPSVAATPAAAPPAPIPARSPPPGPQPPGDLVELKHDQVLAIDRGWIVGPAGATKGFTLINAVLLLLAGGETIPAGVVAKKSGVRSAEAVLAQLTFWRDDLARIGVELIKVTATEIRLRRKSGT